MGFLLDLARGAGDAAAYHMNAQLFRAAIAWGILASGVWARGASQPASGVWQVGKPIVTYWAGPPMTDATAQQMAEGGWNLVWCGEKELDVAARRGLRGQLQDPLLTPASLDDPAQRQKLDALVARVRQHPALYSYFITDEPCATNFPPLGRLVAYLREHDPAHLAYINLFPTYASNEQLGNRGDKVSAYREHLQQYVDIVKPSLISWDHYQFTTNGDTADYFLNLAMVRRAAEAAGLPFLNIVQAASWDPSVRVPDSDEVRYLVYTTLAYGAQGISYYVYCCAGHKGGIAEADGTPTSLYWALKSFNREFEAIAGQLQPLRSLGVYHAGMRPPGTEPLSAEAGLVLEPPVPAMDYKLRERVKGVLIGSFGVPGKRGRAAVPSSFVVVNLDYRTEQTVKVRGLRRLEVFDATTGRWTRTRSKTAELKLGPVAWKLVRVQR